MALVVALSATSGGARSSPSDTAAHEQLGTPMVSRHASAWAYNVRRDERPTARQCAAARAAVRFYDRRIAEYRSRMGAARGRTHTASGNRCPRHLAKRLRNDAAVWRWRARRWWAYHYDWASWMPDKWQRVGACETGFGRRPGNFRWNSGTYQGFVGFYYGTWDQYRLQATPRAGPYPSEAYLATPRQQYEVALAVWRVHGYGAWGCGGA